MISTRRRTALFLVAILALAATDARAEGTFFRPAKQVLPPAETKPASSTATEAIQNQVSPKYPELLSGAPTIVDTATLVVDGHRALLMGLEGLTGSYVQGLQTFIAGYGSSVTCTLLGAGPYYRCVTASQNVDIADAALLNGAARANANATSAQDSKEAQAKAAGRGIWASSGD